MTHLNLPTWRVPGLVFVEGLWDSSPFLEGDAPHSVSPVAAPGQALGEACGRGRGRGGGRPVGLTAQGAPGGDAGGGAAGGGAAGGGCAAVIQRRSSEGTKPPLKTPGKVETSLLCAAFVAPGLSLGGG